MFPGFDRFWSTWPTHVRKVAKAQCLRKWVAKGCEAIADAVVAAVEAAKASEGWTKDRGEFVPAPLVWLNQNRWEAPTEAQAAAEVPENAWHETRKGIVAKGIEVGIGEWSEEAWAAGSMPDWLSYRSRVYRATGYSPRAAA